MKISYWFKLLYVVAQASASLLDVIEGRCHGVSLHVLRVRAHWLKWVDKDGLVFLVVSLYVVSLWSHQLSWLLERILNMAHYIGSHGSSAQLSLFTDFIGCFGWFLTGSVFEWMLFKYASSESVCNLRWVCKTVGIFWLRSKVYNFR